MTRHMRDVAEESVLELMNQHAKWGTQDHPNGTGSALDNYLADRYRKECDAATKSGRLTWRDILLEEVFEALAEHDPELLREELIQTAAVCLQWCMAIDRKRRNQ